jgi:carbamoyltransferase
VSIPEEWTRLFGEQERYRFGEGDGGRFQDCADLAAAGQQAFEGALLEVAGWLQKETDSASLCFAGGTALNCSANGLLLREGPFDQLFIPPSPHDGGTALGSALYGMVACLGRPTGFRWVNDFLGPDPDRVAVEAAVGSTSEDLVVEEPADLIEAMVGLLDSGRVVALHQGRSESGPRALGNRSILADARHPAMQDYINARVKGREWFRPLAPIVLWEEAPKIFDIDRPSPFMQVAANVREACRSWLPAITHVDGTARLQSVDEENTPFLHALLSAFAARTGCPVLLNTSLNGKGDPLVETPEDALRCLSGTGMHALAMPPYLIRKRVEPAVPSR